MKIGNIEIKNGIFLAPMAGYTDRAMRLIAKEFGCEYTTTEMVSAKAVTYGDKKTFRLGRIFSDEGAVALQIFGSEPDVMAEAAGTLLRHESELMAKGITHENLRKFYVFESGVFLCSDGRGFCVGRRFYFFVKFFNIFLNFFFSLPIHGISLPILPKKIVQIVVR